MMDDCFLLSALAPAPELINLVISFVDSVNSLGSLIITCRIFHERFKARKALIISQILRNELGPALIDAKFLSTFPYRKFSGPSTWMQYWDSVHTAAAVYTEMLLGSREASETGETALSLEEATSLCRNLHHTNRLVNAYFAVQLRSFSVEGPGSDLPARPPSRCERQRVLRAFYRRQIISNAWAPTRRALRSGWADEDMAILSNPSDYGGFRLRPGLLAAFTSWELQQVDHIDYFTKRLCAALKLASEANLRRASPLADTDFGNMLTHINCLSRYMRKHPSLVDTAIKALPALPAKIGLSAVGDSPPEYMLLLQRYSLPCFSTGWQRWRAEEFQDPAAQARDDPAQASTDADDQQCQHETIHFAGDAVDRVPYGWVDALGGRAIPWFGEAFYEHPEREWGEYLNEEEETRDMRLRLAMIDLWRCAGFALWDRERVEAMKSLDHLSVLQTGWVL